MRLTGDVYNAAGDKIGIVPRVISASISRVLDGVGTINIDAVATDERTLDLLQNEVRVRIYAEERRQKREIGRGIIRHVNTAITAEGFSLVLDGPDSLDELKRINTLFNRSFELTTVDDVVQTLAGLAGWTAEVDPAFAGELIDARFDGSSILKALQTLIEQRGYHLRMGDSANHVEVGYFGESISLRLINPTALHADAYANKDIAFINNIIISEDSEAVANRMFVLGAGQNVDAALTLEFSTRTAPYEIKSITGPDGRTLYYIEDEESIAAIGVIERVVAFKEIAPLGNNDTAIQTAANMLYDAAAAALVRMAQPLASYTINVRKCEQTVRPGDKVRVSFRGMVEKDSVPFTYRRIEDDFWVMKVTEIMSAGGKRLRLKVSNIDQHEDSAARTVIGALEQITIQGVKVQPTFVRSAYGPYIEAMDSTHPVTVPLIIGNATYRLERCLLRIRSRPFRSTSETEISSNEVTGSGGGTVATSAGGGDHVHRVFRYFGTDPGAGIRDLMQHRIAAGATFGTSIIERNSSSTSDIYTYDASGDHTHDVTIPNHTHTIPDFNLTYGINDDTQYPEGIAIEVNGTEIASGLGTTSTGIDEEYDITDILNTGTLRQTHNIEVTCTDGRGTVEVQFELFDQILPFKLGL